MIKVEFSNESAKELLAEIGRFLTVSNANVEKAGLSEETKQKKQPKTEDDELVKKPAPKEKEAVKLTEDTLRTALVSTGWEAEYLKAFTNKFGYARIPEVPEKKYQEYLDTLAEVVEMTDKKRAAWFKADSDDL